MRTVVYWTSSLLVSVASILAAISYLMAAPQAVAAFTHVGYDRIFEHWAQDGELREAFEPALAWGRAHSDDAG